MLELRRGDTNPIKINCRRPVIDPTTGQQSVDQVGRPVWEPVPLTGATITLTARDRKKNAVIQLDSNPGSGFGGIAFVSPLSSGQAVATVQPSATESLPVPMYLKYDVQLLEADGTKTTVAEGDAIVREDITRG
jgi:hypothetical protein